MDKVRDIVGLYLALPENALVLAVDETSQIQAIDHTAPILPITWCSTTTPPTRPRWSRWLIHHPRFHQHFTPTSSSRLNLVERWLAELTNRKLRRSARRGITELENRHPQMDQRMGHQPTPFAWTKTADQISDTLAACRSRINDPRH